MFERSLIVSQGSHASAEQRWTAVLSITVQVALAGVIVGLPLMHPEVLRVKADPIKSFLPMPKLPQVKLVPVERSAASAAATTVSMPVQSMAFTAPRQISTGINMTPSDDPPQIFKGDGPGMQGGLPDALASVGSGPARTVTVASPRPEKPSRVSSGVMAGMLLAPIRPVYPAIARATRQEGVVVVEAVISKSGAIESLHVVSGPEMLRGAAMDAIRVARYQPFQLNGEPTEVQTTITVNFKMGS